MDRLRVGGDEKGVANVYESFANNALSVLLTPVALKSKSLQVAARRGVVTHLHLCGVVDVLHRQRWVDRSGQQERGGRKERREYTAHGA